MSTMLPLAPDELLSTTRSVRQRLDLSRAVEPELIRECIEVAAQAPARRQRAGLALHRGHRPGQAHEAGRVVRQRLQLFYGDAEAAAARLPQDDPAYVATTRRVVSSGELPGRAPGRGAGARHPLHRGPHRSG